MPKVTSEAPRGLHFEGLGAPKCAQEAHLDAQGGHFEGLGLPKCPQELHLVVAAYFSDSFSALLVQSLYTVGCYGLLLSSATRFM